VARQRASYVGNKIQKQLQSCSQEQAHEAIEIIQRAELRIYCAVLGDVVPEIQHASAAAKWFDALTHADILREQRPDRLLSASEADPAVGLPEFGRSRLTLLTPARRCRFGKPTWVGPAGQAPTAARAEQGQAQDTLRARRAQSLKSDAIRRRALANPRR
jgi:hypothetical protein